MNTTELLLTVIAAYLLANFVCALVLHRHAERQPHLPHRAMDVVVHFVLLTAFAIPVLLVIMTEALFGSKQQREVGAGNVAQARARAA